MNFLAIARTINWNFQRCTLFSLLFCVSLLSRFALLALSLSLLFLVFYVNFSHFCHTIEWRDSWTHSHFPRSMAFHGRPIIYCISLTALSHPYYIVLHRRLCTQCVLYAHKLTVLASSEVMLQTEEPCYYFSHSLTHLQKKTHSYTCVSCTTHEPILFAFFSEPKRLLAIQNSKLQASEGRRRNNCLFKTIGWAYL